MSDTYGRALRVQLLVLDGLLLLAEGELVSASRIARRAMWFAVCCHSLDAVDSKMGGQQIARLR